VFVQNVLSVSRLVAIAFDLDVAYVFTHMLQQYVPNVSAISVPCCSKWFYVASYKCFIWMFNMFHTYVVSAFSKCFNCFQSYVVFMLQVFYDVRPGASRGPCGRGR
jgi:hypothetical protein